MYLATATATVICIRFIAAVGVSCGTIISLVAAAEIEREILRLLPLLALLVACLALLLCGLSASERGCLEI